MKPISLEVIFPAGSHTDGEPEPLLAMAGASATIGEVRQALSGLSAGDRLEAAWLNIVIAQKHADADEYAPAIEACADAMRALLDTDDRKSEDFLALVAGALYDLSYCHYRIGDNKRAEKELIKAQKILDRLAKKNNRRFAATLVSALTASTDIFHSKLKLMNLLAHYQVATELYQDKLASGVSSALSSLVDSLKKQGDIHLQMCNYRDAVRYYTKALRYGKKVNASMGLPELRISLNLAKALLNIINRHAAGRQLLDSLLPLAERLNAKAEIAEIHNLRNGAGQPFDFMAVLKSLF